jgi:hypothetical protein
MCEVEDQSERAATPSELDVMDALAARCLTANEAPYWVAVEAMGALLPLLESEPHAGALYCIWGDLTDSIELGSKPRDEGENRIRRMAREWLDVRSGSSDVSGFVDHWYFEEFGHRRR